MPTKVVYHTEIWLGVSLPQNYIVFAKEANLF